MSASPRWWTHFGLREAPFSKELGDAELWLPPSKQSAVDTLLEGLEERGNALLVGEPGVGKTCVLRALRHRLGSHGAFALTYAHNVTLGRRDFYRTLCAMLGLSTTATAAGVFYALNAHVQELAGERRAHPVFLLDEAHLMHQDLLDHLHVLLNYEWDSRALLSIVLVGLPELEDRLRCRRNRSLYTRIEHRARLDPLSEQDTAAYVRLRLERVGGALDLVMPEALALLHTASGGAHREVDRLASTALRDASRRRRKVVDRDGMQRALAQSEAGA